MAETAWRIDTLDARGGLAFASWRDETLLDDTPLEDVPVFYVGAPSFTPVPIANRSVALAAERYGFQLGLFDEHGEVAFETLDDVGEFMRRLYLSNSRGDPSPPASAPPPPLPPGDSPPSLEPPDLRERPFNQAITRFVETVQHIERGDTEEFSWTETVVGSDSSAWALVHHGAALILVEILARFPNDLNSGHLERWRIGASMFLAVAQRLDLIQDLIEDPDLQDRCVRFLGTSWSLIEGEPQETPRQQAVWTTFQVMAYQTRFSRHYDRGIGNPGAGAFQPMEELKQLPLPEHLAEAIGVAPDVATVAMLSSAMLGHIGAMEDNAGLQAVLLFAACRVATVQTAPFAANQLLFAATEWDRFTLEGRRSLILEAAERWLSENLPRRVFHNELETMIVTLAREPFAQPLLVVSVLRPFDDDPAMF